MIAALVVLTTILGKGVSTSECEVPPGADHRVRGRQAQRVWSSSTTDLAFTEITPAPTGKFSLM